MITQDCLQALLKVGVPPWLYLPELPPDGGSDICRPAVTPMQAAAETPPEPAEHPEHEEHHSRIEGWLHREHHKG